MFKPKIMVEIWHKNGDVTKKKCLVEENTVIIHKGSRKRADKRWDAELNADNIGLEVKGWWIFRKKIPKAVIRSDADQFVNLRKDAVIPTWDKEAARRFVKAKIASKLGDARVKHELPLVFWLLVALGAGVLILQIMQMRGIYFG